jgi:RHS repeat-associated protein
MDHLGSISSIVDGTGSILERRKTDPFGNWLRNSAVPALDIQSLVMSVATHSVRAGFTGQEHDEQLGVVNMGARIYEPLAGRFLSPDAVVGSGMTSQTWNAYTYVLNRPTAFVDPTGNFPSDPTPAPTRSTSFGGYQAERGKCFNADALGCGGGAGGLWGWLRSEPVPLPRQSAGATAGGDAPPDSVGSDPMDDYYSESTFTRYDDVGWGADETEDAAEEEQGDDEGDQAEGEEAESGTDGAQAAPAGAYVDPATGEVLYVACGAACVPGLLPPGAAPVAVPSVSGVLTAIGEALGSASGAVAACLDGFSVVFV